jgi:transcriptional regulator with XRE-family HTH domain
MNEDKRKRLEAKGWKVGTVAEFLGLTEEEERSIELRLVLSRGIKRLREAAGLTQARVAAKMGTSQPRYVKVEFGTAGVSLDLMFKAYFILGGRVADLAPADIIPSEIEAARRAKVEAAPDEMVANGLPEPVSPSGRKRKAPAARKSPTPRAAAKS